MGRLRAREARPGFGANSSICSTTVDAGGDAVRLTQAVRAGQQLRRRSTGCWTALEHLPPRFPGGPLRRCPRASDHAAALAWGTLTSGSEVGLRELPENRRDSRRLRRRVGDVSRRCRGGEPRPDHFKPSKTVPLLLAFPFPSRHHHRAGSTSTTSAEVTSRPTTNAASSAGPMYPAAAGRVRFVGHERTAPGGATAGRFARSRPGARSRTTKSLRSRGRPGARGLRLPTNPNGRTNADVLKPWINGNGPDPATGGEVDRRLRVDDVRRRRGAVRRAAQRSSGEPPAAR